ncbi:hypothetical protein [Agarivorans sp.]|uniref:hypothetical protein n=1 Tax=Agarivorans sp. TaxID=1872412 RepID=UPI003D076D5E
MLKKAAFALAMVSLLALAGQYFTYQQYQAQLKQQLAHLQQQSAWRFQLEQPSANGWKYQEHWLVQVKLSELGLDAEDFGLSDDVLKLHLSHQVTVLPFYLSGTWQLDPTQGSYQQWLQHWQLDEIAHQGKWQANLLSQTLRQQLSIDAFHHQDEHTELTVEPLQVSSRSDLNFQQGELRLTWQGMHLEDKQALGDSVKLGRVSMQQQFSQRQRWHLVDAATWSVDALDIQFKQATEQFSLRHFSAKHQLSEQQQKAYVTLDLNLQHLSLQQQQQQLTINNLLVLSQLGGMPMQDLVALAEAKQQQANEAQFDSLLQQAFAEGLDWQFQQLAVDLDANYPSLQLQGDVKLSGQAKLLPLQLSQLHSPLQLLRYLELNLDIDASDQLLAKDKLAMYVLALRQAGYLNHQQGRDKTQLIFNDSEFTMNNLAVN